MDIWILIVAELIWLTTTLRSQVAAVVLKCDPGKEKNSLDCSYKGPPLGKPTITEISKSINFNHTMSLNVSENKFDAAAVQDLKKFIHLFRFFARRVTLVDAVIPFIGAVSSFKKLEEIDLSFTKFTPGPLDLRDEFKITWPSTLIKVSLRGMNLMSVSLSTLKNLEELDLSSNKLSTLPQLHKLAPAIVINLSDNPLNNITVEQISPYCQMSTFLLQGSKGGTLETNYQICAPLEQWLNKYHITYGSLTCIKIPGQNYPKNFNFSKQALNDREQCENAQSDTSFFELLLMAVFFSILFPVLYFANEAYQRYQSEKVPSDMPSLKEHKRKAKITQETLEIDDDDDNVDSEESSEIV